MFVLEYALGGIMKIIFLCAILGYLFGCFQTSYFIGKIFKKVDIRDFGNGNAGASNTTVALGWKYGILVGLVDILKAVISILIIKYIFKDSIDNKHLMFFMYLNGVFVILGHNFPFFMKFKGGKGTASLVGMLIAIDIRLAVIGILAIVLITIITNYIALGTIGLVTSFTIGTVLFRYNTACLIIALIITLMSIYKHISNIKKIINGTETGLRQTLK